MPQSREGKAPAAPFGSAGASPSHPQDLISCGNLFPKIS